MPSLWRRVVQPKKDLEARRMIAGSPQAGKQMYQHEDVAATSETRLHYLKSGKAIQLLRQVHLVDPVQSPSWSGIQRSTQGSHTILHMIEEETSKLSEASQLLQPGIVNLTGDPNMLSVRGLLLDTIRHVGPVTEQSNFDQQSYKPPKWLTKLAINSNSAALQEVPLNVAANPSIPSSKSRASSQAALQEKYDDFMTFIFALVKAQRQSAQPRKPKELFANVRMCVTETGYFGLVPPSSRPGDNIFMVERDLLKSIFIIRKHPVHGFFLWNGLVYIHNVAQVVNNEYATDRILVG